MSKLIKSSFFQLPIIKKPLLAIYNFLWWRVLGRCLSDRSFLSLKYRLVFKKRLNWDSPQTYSEKIQWLKIYGREPIHKIMADKYLVKDYISKKIGEQYVIPLIGVWDNENEIDFDALPERFVLKCNHDSGTGMVICKDKSKLNIEKAKAGLHKGLREDYFPISREYAYKDIPRKIIAEQYMEDSETLELRDYKFFCFDGEPKAMFIAAGRSQGEENVTFDFFDMEFNHLPFTNGHPNAKVTPKKPVCFDEMKKLAAQLSVGIPHVRVDFYEVDGRVYFGEFTFSHWGGLKPFDPEEWDYTFGSWIKLPVE
jgi:hypothetical protein